MLSGLLMKQRAPCRTAAAVLQRRQLSAAAATGSCVAIGLGNMGAPLAGRIAAKFPTSAFDMSSAAAERHAAEYGSVALSGAEELNAAVAAAEVVVTCLPNTDATLATVDLVRPSLKPGTVWIDATSGKSEDAAALAAELWEKHSVRYLDCAVSGGPKGATNGILAALVGGDKATFEGVEPVISTFSDKITHLGPAGSGHLVKAINNALLAANMLTASEGLAALARHGVELPSALQAINGSSGRSWVTMQRFPDNILTGNAYGFALGMHCKDMDNAMEAILTPHPDGTEVSTPMLELTRSLMNGAREDMGGEVDHTDTSKLAAAQHKIDFENL